MTQKTSQIIGTFEPVAFPQFGITDIVAKIDTGAFTGALHCTKILEKDGVLHFSPFDHPEITMRYEQFAIRFVKSSNGSKDKRYFIKTTIEIRGNVYPVILSLADRTEMKWPVLIGRRFLRRNNFLVDVRQGAEYPTAGKD